MFVYPLGKPVPLSYMNAKAHHYFYWSGNESGNIAKQSIKFLIMSDIPELNLVTKSISGTPIRVISAIFAIAGICNT